MQTISVEELKNKMESEHEGEVLVDVREPFEYKAESIPGAENIPLSTLSEALSRLKETETVCIQCRSGGRSGRACEMLEAEGVHVVNIEGGIEAWKAAGFPIHHSE
jgi:rhodanese-related sulfurtransferase